MKSRVLRSFAALALLAIPLVASADNLVVEAAQVAVRRAIRTKLGTAYRVVFESAAEKFLSFSETTVFGDAHAVQGDDWRVDRSFKYSVKVKNDASQTRDVTIDFVDGDSHRDGSDWEQSHHEDEYIHLNRPEWYEHVKSKTVVFDGHANETVTIVIYRSDGRRVSESTVTPFNGRFRKSVELPAGTYRATYKPRLAVDHEEVRFTVDRAADDWGTDKKPGSKNPEDIVEVAEPRHNETLRSNRVTISGTCSEREVRVQIWDSRNNRVADRDVPAKNDYWNTQIELKNGKYRIAVESPSKRDKDEYSFTVEARDTSKAPSATTFRVTDPVNESTLRGPRVTIAGTCSERSVIVQVWDSRNNRLADRNVPTRNGYFNTQIELPPGSYRAAVESVSGRDRRGFRFSVKKK